MNLEINTAFSLNRHCHTHKICSFKSASVLKSFIRQFRIEGVEDPSDPSPRGPGPKGAVCGAAGFRWREFMEKVKPSLEDTERQPSDQN